MLIAIVCSAFFPCAILAGPATADVLSAEDPSAEDFNAEDLGASDDSSATDPYVSFRVKEWTLDDGLSLPLKYVAQTPDGYLWMTTWDGLLRFDGVRFRAYTTDNTPAFRQHDFVGLYVAENGDLWTGGRDGWVYRRRGETWTAYDVREILNQHWVQGFAEDGTGTLWLVSTGPVTARLEGDTWREVEPPIRDVWTPFVADRHGTIWTLQAKEDAPGRPEMIFHTGVVSRWTGAAFEPVEDARWQGFTATQNGPLFHRVRNPRVLQQRRSPPVAQDRTEPGNRGAADGKVPMQGPVQAQGPVQRFRVELSDADGTAKGWFWSDGTPAIARLVDRAGRVWVQRMKNGVMSILTVERNGVELARIEPEGNNWIEQVFEDRQGNVWLHSRSSGLIQVSEEPFRRFGTDDGVPRFALRASESPDGSILVSTEADVAGPNVSRIRDGTVAPLTVRLSSAPAGLQPDVENGVIEAGHVTADADGQAWGLFEPYLLQVNNGDSRVVWQTGGPTLWALYPDPAASSTLWLGAAEGGRVYQFDTRRLAPADSFRVSGRVNRFHRGPTGDLWIGTEEGLWVKRADGSLERQTSRAMDGHNVRGFLNGPHGALWVATAGGGLIRLRDGTARALRTRHGLPSDHLSAVVLDTHGFLWLSGRQVLLRLSLDEANAVLDGEKERAEVIQLLPSAGHLGSSNKLTHALSARDGSLWFPSDRGVTRVDPARYAEQYREPLPVLIESVQTAQGTGVSVSDSTGASGTRLPIGERTLTVRYTAPELVSPSLVRFRTRLDGRDTGWVDRGPERQVTYGGLAPGEYTVHVQAMSAGGEWSPSVATLTWTVPRTFTETWWFLGLCALGILSAGWIAFSLRVRALKRREQTLNTLVDEQTNELRTEKQKVSAQAEALRALDDAKSRVFANISHEFRTPLTLTLGPLDDLRDGLYGPLPAPMVEQVELARRNANRVLDLVNQLLDVARLEAGQVRLSAQPVNLSAFAEGAVEVFRPMAERNAISLILDDPADATHPSTHSSNHTLMRDAQGEGGDGASAQRESVWGNPEQLQIVFSNLLSNALKFTPEGGSVRVSLRRGEGTVSVSVRDSGPGIPAADVPHVFDRFYRSDADPLYQPSGSGIGLALTKELVELHHGRISVESEQGFGSEFTVTFPTGREHLSPDEHAADQSLVETFPGGAPRILATAASSTPQDASGRNGSESNGAEPNGAEETDAATLLLVEDHDEVRGFIRAHLAESYHLLEAGNGREGLDLAREHQPDLIISDVMMPEMDGFELCAALRDDPSTDFIPIILLTARAERDDRIDGLEQGADAYLTKPFDVGELRAQIANLLRSRRSLQERFAKTTVLMDAASVDLPSADRTFIDAVRSAIEDNLGDETFTVGELADLVGLSRTHLYRRLQELVDLSPSALIRTMRLKRACQMLEQDAATVSEVAFAVGYKSSSHFSRSFRKHVGHTPSEYAEMTPTEL